MREIDFWRNNMLIFNSSSLAEIATTLGADVRSESRV